MPERGRDSTAESNPIKSHSISGDPNLWPLDEIGPDDVFRRLDKGEASIICDSIQSFRYMRVSSTADINEYEMNHTPIATDDRDARQFAKKYGIPITGSVGILAKAVKEDIITLETADEDLDAWVDGNGYRSPIESIGEIL